METVKAIWSVLKSDTASLGIAGISGAIVASMVEWGGWLLFARRLAVGGICAIYMAPLSIPLLSYVLVGLSIDETRAPTLGGFIMGLIGMMVVDFLLQIFQSRRILAAVRKAQSKDGERL